MNNLELGELQAAVNNKFIHNCGDNECAMDAGMNTLKGMWRFEGANEEVDNLILVTTIIQLVIGDGNVVFIGMVKLFENVVEMVTWDKVLCKLSGDDAADLFDQIVGIKKALKKRNGKLN